MGMIAIIMLIIFYDFLMVQQNFLSPQVKRTVIINCQTILKKLTILKNYCLLLSPPPEMKILSVLAKFSWEIEIEHSRSALFHMKIRVSLKRFVNDCLWQQFLDSNTPHSLSNLIYLNSLVTLRPLTQFQPKIRAINLQKSAKICLT